MIQNAILQNPASGQIVCLEPFLHIDRRKIFNPLTDRTLSENDPGFDFIQNLASKSADLPLYPESFLLSLIADGWLVEEIDEPGARFLLKYVSLEATSACNQSCFFCPVSIAPREPHTMSLELYEGIVRQIAEFRETLKAVFMINYNEPTIDRFFLQRAAILRDYQLPIAVNSNGSGLTAHVVDRLIELGGLAYLSINLSTVDRDEYARTRGRDHLPTVLANLDYAKDKPLAERMDMAVLGTGDENHKANFEAIKARFAGSLFKPLYFEIEDRAGYLPVGLKRGECDTLRGCNSMGSRPLQHLHVNAYGRCIICCEDYDDRFIVGDVNCQSVKEILTGPEFIRIRKWAYGLEEAPDDFICKNCVFARS